MKEIIITSSVLILCIVLVRSLFRGKIGSRLQYALWLLVAVRLLVPVTAQLYLSFGVLNEIRIVDLVEDLEARIGNITERLDQPVGFVANMDSMLGRQIAERVLGDEITQAETGDGPTSIFLAGTFGVTWMNIIRGIWIGGMGIMALWMLAVNLRFRHKLHEERHRFQVPDSVRDRLDPVLSGRFFPKAEAGQGKRMGRRRGIRFYTVERLNSPCLYGLPGREAVYLPENIAGEEEKLRHVLTHELCHKRHGDGFWSLLRNILLALYWFHPLVWLAAVLSKRDCELACDEGALLLLGEGERIDYGRTLLSIIGGRRRFSDLACTATTMTGTGRRVKERICYIAKKPKVLGTAVAAVLILMTALSLLVFTKSPRFVGGIWDSGTIYVMTEDKRIMLPDTIAGISGYADVEGEQADLIIYQVASDQEVGRFRTVSYEEAVELVDAGRTVVPLGDYGSNLRLKQYMGFQGVEAHTYVPRESITGLNQDTPDMDESTVDGGMMEEMEKSMPPRSGKEPFAFDGKTEWIDDGSNQSSKKPFVFDGQYEWELNNEPEMVTDGLENGVPGTDSNEDSTYMIEDPGADNTVEYLPDESVTVTYIPEEFHTGECYLYVTAEHAKLREKYWEEMAYIDGELQKAAGQAIVTRINRGVSEETFETLAGHRTRYLGNNA